jgi:hypothetical protein
VGRAVRDWEGVCELEARVGLDVGELVAEGSAGGSGDSDACGESVAAEVGDAWVVSEALREALSELEAELLQVSLAVSLLVLVSLPVPDDDAVALPLPVSDSLPVHDGLGQPGLTLTEADTSVALAVGETALGVSDGVAVAEGVAVACGSGMRGVLVLLFEAGGVFEEEALGSTEFVGDTEGSALLVWLGLGLKLPLALLAPAADNTHPIKYRTEATSRAEAQRRARMKGIGKRAPS